MTHPPEYHLFAQAYRYAPIGLCTLDLELRFVHVNEWLARLNGLAIAEHLGRRMADIIPNLYERVSPQLYQVIETGWPIIKGHVYAETHAHPGEKHHYQHDYYAVRHDGETVGVSCVVEDLTDGRGIAFPDDLLSARENQTLGLGARGFTNEESAHWMGVSVRTVETYRRRAMKKLGTRQRVDLIRYALDHGLHLE